MDEGPPDQLLLDVMRPDGDGPAICGRRNATDIVRIRYTACSCVMPSGGKADAPRDFPK
jgi:hypothetical protein